MTLLPNFGAATFTQGTTITNPLFPLTPGTITAFHKDALEVDTRTTAVERNDVFVKFETRTITGVETVVVRDTAFDDRKMIEDTLDWYAQDDLGNVWYLGEIPVNHNYDNDGKFTGTDFGGGWETGVDGAVPGYNMEASPNIGDRYFQEFYAGVAEDEREVVATGLTITTNLGTFTGVTKILDTQALEPSAGAFKYFAPGVRRRSVPLPRRHSRHTRT